MSVKAQAQSKIPVPSIDTFPDVMRSLFERHKMTVKSISDNARLSPARIREFLGGDDLPSKAEFKRLGHALPQITYVFKLEQFEDPTEERQTAVDHLEQEVATEPISTSVDVIPEVQAPVPEVQASEIPGLQVTSIEPISPEPQLLTKPTPEYPRTFGETLREARNQEGLSRADIAQLLGVSKTAVEYWEADRYPYRHNFISLVQLFPVLARFDAEVNKVRKQKEPLALQITEEKPLEITQPSSPPPAAPPTEGFESTPSYFQVVELGEKLAAIQRAPNFSFLLEILRQAQSLGFDLGMLVELLENR